MPVLHPIRAPSGFLVIPIHYTHDPAKTIEWAVREKLKYTASGGTEADWRREMEIDFSASAGTLAYPAYSSAIHLVNRVELVRGVPLCLWMDFNVQPMIWGAAQIVHGWLNCLRTFELSPARIDLMVNEFRNLYPAHNAELWIYGDATGTHRDHQTGQSDYDLVKAALVGYNAPVVFKVPLANPEEKDRLNAVAGKLMPPSGMPGVRIDRNNCPHLVKDFEQVILDPRGKIAKTYDGRNPYSKLTHASDGFGYLVWREWPTSRMTASRKVRPAPPLKYGRLLGDP